MVELKLQKGHVVTKILPEEKCAINSLPHFEHFALNVLN